MTNQKLNLEAIPGIQEIDDATAANHNGGSFTPGGDSDPSDENQAALEERFIALYEQLMEKQVSFKESIEPFKTDNQNAGKG